MRLDKLIDKFAETVNCFDKEPLDPGDLPEFLRIGESTKLNQFYWEIKKQDLSQNVESIESKLPKRFPESFSTLISTYAFPAFETEGIFLYANTGADMYWELSKRIFSDSYMSEFLLQNGFIQFGNPYEFNYNPVCFDFRNTKQKKSEFPVVELDHEMILINSKIAIVNEISPSFRHFLESIIKPE